MRKCGPGKGNRPGGAAKKPAHNGGMPRMCGWSRPMRRTADAGRIRRTIRFGLLGFFCSLSRDVPRGGGDAPADHRTAPLTIKNNPLLLRSGDEYPLQNKRRSSMVRNNVPKNLLFVNTKIFFLAGTLWSIVPTASVLKPQGVSTPWMLCLQPCSRT